jgi:hypothetical protein
MRILCLVGFHKPRAGARWNAGYGFSSCRRCGCDLVRPVNGLWRAPRGYRVVWRSKAETASAILTHDPHQPVQSKRCRDISELPVQAVLRLLQSHDFVDKAEEQAGWDHDIGVDAEQAISRVGTGDFMAPTAADVTATVGRRSDNGSASGMPAAPASSSRRIS